MSANPIIPAPAHLSAKGYRNLPRQRARPLVPSEDLPDDVTGLERLVAIPAHLDVERSGRYLKKDGATYCNIYATDVAYLCGIYLARVWWKHPERWEPGTPAIWDRTVRELSADALTLWLAEWGSRYGWEVEALKGKAATIKARAAAANALQVAVNDAAAQGAPRLGVISAFAPGRQRGHIAVVLPEREGEEGWQAERDGDGVVTAPLQSQAGGRNRRLFTSDWYRDRDFSEVVFAHAPVVR